MYLKDKGNMLNLIFTSLLLSNLGKIQVYLICLHESGGLTIERKE